MTSTVQDRLVGVIGDFAYKAPCRVVATTPVTTSGTQTIDGVALAVLDRVLVSAQADNTNNGIYTVDSTAWELAPDFLSSQSVARGSQVFVTDGTTNSHTIWYIVATNPVLPQDPSNPSAIVVTKLALGGAPGGSNGQLQYNNSSAFGGVSTVSGDATLSIPAGVLTLATVNGNVGSFTNATVTVNAKGLVTAAASGSISGGSTLYHTTGDPAVDVVSTSSETTLITYSLPGGTLSTGGILMAVLRGDLFNNQSGVACTYTFRVKYGGTTLCSFALANGTGPGSPGPPAFWRLDFTLAARGSASKQYFNGRITQNDGAAAEGASSPVAIDAMGENNASAEASAGALNIVVTVQMNQNNALNETRLYSASITQVA